MLLGKRVTKIVSLIQETIKDNSFLKFQVKKWSEISEYGQKEVVDEATRNEDDVNLVPDRLNSDRCLSMYQIAETVNISKSTVHHAVTAFYLEGSKDLKGG